MESLIPNYTTLIQIFNFLFLIFLLNIIVFRPVRKILIKRKEDISSEEETARTLDQEAEKYSSELEINVSETRKNGIKEKDTLRADGLEEEQKMLKEVYSIIEERLKKTRAEIEEKSKTARESLEKEVKGFSRDLSEKFLGRGI